MKSKVTKYIEGWNEHPQVPKISMAPIAYGGRVYNIEVRFPASMYGHRCEEHEFDKMAVKLLGLSAGALKVSSTYSEFWSGILSLKVAFKNHGYSDKYIVKALAKLATEIIPSLGEEH